MSATFTNDCRQTNCRAIPSSQMINIFCLKQIMYEPHDLNTVQSLKILHNTNAKSVNSVICYVSKYESEEQTMERNQFFCMHVEHTHFMYRYHHYQMMYNFTCNQHVITTGLFMRMKHSPPQDTVVYELYL
jgi:hypothetical protein